MTKLLTFLIKPRLADQLRSMLASVAGSPSPAIALRDQNDQTTVGVVVPPDEYELLIATYRLVKSPNGPAKIAGTYPYREKLPEAISLEDAIARYQ